MPNPIRSTYTATWVYSGGLIIPLTDTWYKDDKAARWGTGGTVKGDIWQYYDGSTLRFEPQQGNQVSGDYLTFIRETPDVSATIDDVTQANPAVVTTSAAHGYSNGDAVYIENVGGMTELNGKSWLVDSVGATTYNLQDLNSQDVNSSGFGAYTTGGVSREVDFLTADTWSFVINAHKYAASYRANVTNGLKIVANDWNTIYSDYENQPFAIFKGEEATPRLFFTDSGQIITNTDVSNSSQEAGLLLDVKDTLVNRNGEIVYGMRIAITHGSAGEQADGVIGFSFDGGIEAGTSGLVYGGDTLVIVNDGTVISSLLAGFHNVLISNETDAGDMSPYLNATYFGSYATAADPTVDIAGGVFADGKAVYYGFVEGSVTTQPHAVFLANSAGGTVLPSAFKAFTRKTTAGGFTYGLDLLDEAGDGNNIKTADIRGDQGDTIGNLVAGTWAFDTGIKILNGTTIDEFSIDGALAGNSDNALPTEQAVKTYVDAAVLLFDTWLELTDTPNAFTSDKGRFPLVNNAENALIFSDVVDILTGGAGFIGYAAGTTTGNITGFEIDASTNLIMGTDFGVTALKLTAKAPNGSGTSYIIDGWSDTARVFSVDHLGVLNIYDPSSAELGTISRDGTSLFVDSGTGGTLDLKVAGTSQMLLSSNVWTHTPSGASFDFHQSSASRLIIFGGDAWRNDLTLQANSNDTYPYLSLNGNDRVLFDVDADQSINFLEEGLKYFYISRRQIWYTTKSTTSAAWVNNLQTVTSGFHETIFDSDILTTGGWRILGGAAETAEWFKITKNPVDIEECTLTLAGDLSVTGAHTVGKTNVADANYNPSALTQDNIISVTTLTAARTVTISTEDRDTGTTTQPRIITIKDESGNCSGINTITINLETAGTIDGAVTFVLNAAYNSVTIYIDGANGWVM